MKCAFSKCKNNADNMVSNNLNNDGIPFCNKCIKNYETHLMAREQNFKEIGKEEMIKEFEKIIDEMPVAQQGADGYSSPYHPTDSGTFLTWFKNKIKQKLKELKK